MFLLIANKGVFLHTHHFADGSVVVHAHPFNKSNDNAPDNSHNHTKKELILIQHIDNPNIIIITQFCSLIVVEVAYSYFNQNIQQSSPILTESAKGRSPPIC